MPGLPKSVRVASRTRCALHQAREGRRQNEDTSSTRSSVITPATQCVAHACVTHPLLQHRYDLCYRQRNIVSVKAYACFPRKQAHPFKCPTTNTFKYFVYVLWRPIDVRTGHLQQFFYMTIRPFDQHPNTSAKEAPSLKHVARLGIRWLILVWNSYELDMTNPSHVDAGNVRLQNYRCRKCSRSKSTRTQG